MEDLDVIDVYFTDSSEDGACTLTSCSSPKFEHLLPLPVKKQSAIVPLHRWLVLLIGYATIASLLLLALAANNLPQSNLDQIMVNGRRRASYHPQTVYLDRSSSHNHHSIDSSAHHNHTMSLRVSQSKTSDDKSTFLNYFRDPYKDHPECVPMYEWQTKSFPTCNYLHEVMDPTELYYLSHGYFRSVFELLVDYGETSRKPKLVALKLLNYPGHKVNDRNMVRHARDATIAGMLKSSPNVVDIYGYCGNSALYEYGSKKLGSAMMVGEDKANDMKMLRLFSDIANGLKDVHALGGGKYPAVSHTDINYSQILAVDGTYKISDFNRAHFHYWNSSSQLDTCPYIYQSSNNQQHRSPEEYSYELQTEKIDIFSLGNVFYVILFKRMPFEDVKTSDMQRLIRHGVRDELPLDMDNTIHKIFAQVIHMCWKHDWRERATAKEIANYLAQSLDLLNGDGKDSVAQTYKKKITWI